MSNLQIKDCLITCDFVFFWKSIFSQWQKSLFNEGDLSFVNAEQWMMYKKAILFNDNEVADLIIKETSPKVIKDYGRLIKNFDHFIWDQMKISVVTKGNYLKFSQDNNLKEILLSTENRILVEASPVDNVWGIGMASDHEEIHNIFNWRGENLLGKCLMNVREILK